MDITPYINDAKRIQAATGIPASIILGQMKLESSGKNNGLSGLAYYHNNFFGIKGKGDAGSVYLPTREVVNGKSVTVNAAFRKYSSPYASMMDHARLLQTERYASKLTNAKTVEDYAVGIKAGGYATDPKYVSLLMGVITGNNLSQYDSGKPLTSPGGGGYQPLEGETIPGGTSPGGSAALGTSTDEKTGFVVGTVRALFIVGVMVIGIVFFMKAFPTVGEGMKKGAGAAASVIPVGKIGTVVKGAAKVAGDK